MTERKKKQRPWKVFIAIILGMIIGSLTQKGSSLFGIDLFATLLPVYALCGKLFINALTLVVVPLVSSSIITGIARIGGEKSFGRLGLKTFGFYLGTSLLAILIGLFFVNVLHPGSSINPETMAGTVNISEIQKHLSTQESTRFTDILMQVIPSNIVDTLAKGKCSGSSFLA